MISLTTRKIDRRLKDYHRIMEMMVQTFPKEELFPLWYLRLLTHRKGIEYKAYYDGDTLCGFTYCVKSPEMVFVLYLAVNAEIRSKGYGSAILQKLKEENEGKTIALNIEPPDPKAANNEQREKRLSFYVRNGFYSTERYLGDKDERYLVLACGKEFSEDDYKEVLKKLSFTAHVPTVSRI